MDKAKENLDDVAGENFEDRAALALKIMTVVAIDVGDLAGRAKEVLGRERLVEILKDTEELQEDQQTDVFEYVKAIMDEQQ